MISRTNLPSSVISSALTEPGFSNCKVYFFQSGIISGFGSIPPLVIGFFAILWSPVGAISLISSKIRPCASNNFSGS